MRSDSQLYEIWLRYPVFITMVVLIRVRDKNMIHDLLFCRPQEALIGVLVWGMKHQGVLQEGTQLRCQSQNPSFHRPVIGRYVLA